MYPSDISCTIMQVPFNHKAFYLKLALLLNKNILPYQTECSSSLFANFQLLF